eukprot:2529272-Amphidinium_carterae.1
MASLAGALGCGAPCTKKACEADYTQAQQQKDCSKSVRAKLPGCGAPAESVDFLRSSFLLDCLLPKKRLVATEFHFGTDLETRRAPEAEEWHQEAT